ncbi:hypothetical protein [Acidaminobacter hydrogenoformans]|uniref:Uncharacterized protein n=1 Tax=Acidaminobacter hydrogenoformans DSM 2784 TaxID=1120920 RepID=A0A1G5S5K3_9FIRM|nr:hypothetical protein [Acidaminobacter hydrogenoformans]SCZ81011.1 hypothetical protein SAMN03080599_02562 [Acidaminobacter hydrogenoformans DSM 2784]
MELTEKQKEKKNFWVELMDSMFIMVLCFATLLTAMLMSGKSDGALSYGVDFKTLGLVCVSLVIYLAYVLYQSDRELKSMIQNLYCDSETTSIEVKGA